MAPMAAEVPGAIVPLTVTAAPVVAMPVSVPAAAMLTAPVALPWPFQLPPVAPRVPAIVPVEEKLMMPLPLTVALPLTVPEPLRVPAVATLTMLAAAVEPVRASVPELMLVGPV